MGNNLKGRVKVSKVKNNQDYTENAAAKACLYSLDKYRSKANEDKAKDKIFKAIEALGF